LSKDLVDLRKRQDDDERLRKNLEAEFLNFKSEQNSRFKEQELELGRCERRLERCEKSQQTLKTDIERTREGLEKALQIANSARDTANEVQESSKHLVKDGIDTVMAEATNAAGPTDASLEEALKSLESLQQQSEMVNTNCHSIHSAT
jgi:sugar-specific transcriptional regulator TrmB